MKYSFSFIGIFIVILSLIFVGNSPAFAAVPSIFPIRTSFGNLFPSHPLVTPSLSYHSSVFSSFTVLKTHSMATFRQATEHSLPYPYFDGQPFVARFWNIKSGTPSGTPTIKPVLTRVDKEIHFVLDTFSLNKGLSRDHFYAEWEKKMNFSDGNYRFMTTSDDGVRVYLDDKLVLANWSRHTQQDNIVDRTITSGIHTIRVDYYQDGGKAVMYFSLEKVADPGGAFTGEYFLNPGLQGLPDISRQDESLDFSNSSFLPNIFQDASSFSIRWTKQQHFVAGNYSFLLNGSGGVRFWIDTFLLVDDWNDHGAKTYNPSIYLPEGMHTLKIEYFEGGAQPSFSFEQQ